MPSVDTIDLRNEPETILIGKGMTMTFLRDSDYLTRTHITGEEALSVPLHYHETHDEIFRILKGRVQYTLGEPGAKFKVWSRMRPTVKIYTPEDGEVIIPKGTAHSLLTFPGEEVELEERTTPMDVEKEVFFRNIFAAGGLSAHPLAVMQSFYHGDGYPVFPGGLRFLEKGFVVLLGHYIAPMLGYKPKYDIANLKKY